jgi:hypothetical protein
MAKGAVASFWRKMYYDLANEVEQVLGKALGYPKYSDDQKNFPGTTEADGVCVGDSVPESLVAQAAGHVADNRAAKMTLQAVLDRDWNNETLRQTANIAANAIYWRDEQIKDLKRRIVNFEDETTSRATTSLWSEYVKKTNYPAMFGGLLFPDRPIIPYKIAVFDDSDNVPCTAEIEVAFEKLASYFEKRSKENARRAEKEEKKVEMEQQKSLKDWRYHEEVGADRSGYYFSGKADSYKRAAEKVREILGK